MRKYSLEKVKRKYLLILLSVIVATSLLIYKSINGLDNNLTKKEKIEDFQYMYDVIETSYSYLELNKRVNNVDWLENKEIYLEKIKNTKNDSEFINELNNILGDLNNGHTHLIDNYSLFKFFYNGYGQSGWYEFFNDDRVKNRYEGL